MITPQTDFIQVRLDSKTKIKATNILDKLGMTPSQAVKLFLTKVVMTKSIPFSLELSNEYIEQLSEKQSVEVGQALEEIKNGQYTDVDMSDKKQVKKFFGV